MRRSRLAVLIWLAAGVVSETATAAVEEVASNLVCPCGCDNMIVSSCTCGTAQQIRAEIQGFLEQGLGKEEIWRRYAEQYGQKAPATPPMRGFHVAVWVLPFVALVVAGGLPAAALRRWAAKETAHGVGESEDGAAFDRRLMEILSREMQQFQR